MSKKNSSNRAERIARNNQRLQKALNLFTVGFITECYLLVINRFYVRGSVDQLVAVASYLEVMVFVGAALVAAGIVFYTLRGKKPCNRVIAGWCLGLGVFLTLSSELMRKVYPAGTTILCILIPVLMLLAVVYLLYPAEFSVEATALVLTLAVAALVNHGAAAPLLAMLIKASAVIVLILLAGAAVCIAMLQKKEGVFKGLRIFARNTCYYAIYAVLALSVLCTAVVLFAPGTAYYVLWIGAIALFLMAVLHTVKLL